MKKLFPYQQEGVAKALEFFQAGRTGVIIGDEPGLGKTVQALELVNELQPRHALVVCPSSLKLNWKIEADVWLQEPRPIHVAQGRGAEMYTPGFEVMSIINYDLLTSIDFSQHQYDMIIFDEAHKMKNPDAKRTMAGAGIPSTRRVLLTGTPIISRPKEIWQLLVLCGVVERKHFHAFGLKYCAAFQEHEFRYDHKLKKTVRKMTWNYDGESNLHQLNYWLKDLCMIRRLKRDVLKDLPPKTRQIVELKRNGKSDLSRADYKDAVKSLAFDQQMAFEEISLIRHETALEKLPQAIAFIEDQLDASEKVVIFAHHRDVLDGLSQELGDYNPVSLIGGMKDERKQWSVDYFQNDPETRLFLGQIQAAGEGLTLTAASHVIFVELDWTPAGMQQCEDRCHRIGQKDNVLVQHLVFEDSIDAKIAKALLRKQKILDTAIDGQVAGMDRPVEWNTTK